MSASNLCLCLLFVSSVFSTTVPGSPAGSVQEQVDESSLLPSALEKAAGGEWEKLHFEVECQAKEGFRALEVFGTGIGIWDRRSQFPFEKSQIQQSLRVFKESNFSGMPEKFGGTPQEETEPHKHAVRVTCRVSLNLNGISKQVVQLEEGEQSAGFKQLANRLLELSSGPAKDGVAAESLDDGLAKLSDGRLSPEVLHILINRKPVASELKNGAPGWILRISGREISVQKYLTHGGQGPVRHSQLDDSALRQLAIVLKDQNIESFPVNLYAEHYTDFSVQVLNHKKNIQARQFAGMTPETHREKQKSFDKIFQFLDELRKTVER